MKNLRDLIPEEFFRLVAKHGEKSVVFVVPLTKIEIQISETDTERIYRNTAGCFRLFSMKNVFVDNHHIHPTIFSVKEAAIDPCWFTDSQSDRNKVLGFLFSVMTNQVDSLLESVIEVEEIERSCMLIIIDDNKFTDPILEKLLPLIKKWHSLNGIAEIDVQVVKLDSNSQLH